MFYNHNFITSDLSWSTVNRNLQNNVVVNDGENVSLNNIEESVSENIVLSCLQLSDSLSSSSYKISNPVDIAFNSTAVEGKLKSNIDENEENSALGKCVLQSSSHFISSSSVVSNQNSVVINSENKYQVSDSHSAIRILALNVCGLVAKFKAPELEELCNKYDILCFSETKLDQYDVVEIKHFKALPPLNRKNAKHKSGGIIVFYLESVYIHIDNKSNMSPKVLLNRLYNNAIPKNRRLRHEILHCHQLS